MSWIRQVPTAAPLGGTHEILSEARQTSTVIGVGGEYREVLAIGGSPTDWYPPLQSFLVRVDVWRAPLASPTALCNASDNSGMQRSTRFGVFERTINLVYTRGLACTITLADGMQLTVKAEEEPGKLYERAGDGWRESSRVVSDWRFVVELNALSEPRPAG